MDIPDHALMFPTVYVSLSRGFTDTHRGIDLGWNANEGGGNVDIFAPADGTVITIIEGKDNDPRSSAWGNCVKIDHGGGIYTQSAHMLKGSINETGLKVGDSVKRGQKIGRMNNSGYSFGNHDHFEVYLGGTETGCRVDPLQYCFVYPHQKVGSASECKAQIRYLEETPAAAAGKPVKRDTSKDQLEIQIKNLRGRSGAYLMDNVLGYMVPGFYNVLETKDMTHEASNGYLWYCVGDGLWCAGVKGVTYHPKTEISHSNGLQQAVNEAYAILRPYVR